jgi:hypothetical protein
MQVAGRTETGDQIGKTGYDEMMAKKNIIMIGTILFAVLLVCLSGYLLYRGINDLDRAELKLKDTEETLKKLHGSDPFPTIENVNKEKQNVQSLADGLGKLMDNLKAGQVQANANVTPSTFMTLFFAKRTELVNKAREHGTIMPPDFAFGFDRYCAANSPLPPPAELPLLSRQLVIIETLSSIIIDEKATNLNKIVREESNSTAGTNGVVAVSKAKQLFTKLHFTIEFKAKEAALLGILNSIASNKMFMAVSSLQVDKEGGDVLDVNLPRARSDDDEVKKPAVGVNARASGSSPSGEPELMCGLKLEKPMRVKLAVEVYRFAEE